MSGVVERLDDLGMPAWIGLMILGFVLFWPVGLGILAFLIGSGRMGCGGNGSAVRGWEQRMSGMQEKLGRWGCRRREREDRGRMTAFSPSGNRAFDEYREETLRRLEEEAAEFTSFLERLRHAKDKAEFEQFMAERRTRPEGEVQPPERM